MSNDRSPDTPVAADPASWADGIGGDGRDLPQSRGFLGRILGAFSGGETEPPPADADDKGASLPATAVPGMVNLRRMRVDDVAIPKAEIVAAPITATLAELVEMFGEHGFSRIPVFRGTLDSPLGLIHLKDLALKYGFGAKTPVKFNLRPMLRPLLYVPPSMPIGVLLQQMQKERIHMALVIDEYGGVDGLVTIEDLIEQVIGEIEDEHDVPDLTEKQVGPDEYVLSCRLEVKYLNEKYGLGIEESREYDTLAGFIIFNYEGIPTAGETVFVGGLQVRILRTTRSRIDLARVRKL